MIEDVGSVGAIVNRCMRRKRIHDSYADDPPSITKEYVSPGLGDTDAGPKVLSFETGCNKFCDLR
jgi:hypothetical protein